MEHHLSNIWNRTGESILLLAALTGSFSSHRSVSLHLAPSRRWLFFRPCFVAPAKEHFNVTVSPHIFPHLPPRFAPKHKDVFLASETEHNIYS